MKAHLTKIKNHFLKLSTQLKPVVIGIALILLWMISGILKSNHSEHISTNVEFAKVIYKESKAQDIVKTLHYHSISEAENKTTVLSTNSGKIIEVMVAKGDLVKIDQKLAIIAPPDYASILSSAIGKVREIEDIIGNEKIPSVALLSQLKQAKADLVNAERYSKNMTIHSPINGRIEKIIEDVGDSVSAHQKLFLIVDSTKLIFKIYVSEKDISQIKTEKIAYIKTVNNLNYEGKVSFVSNAANSENLSYDVEVKFDNKDNKIPEGATAEITIPTQTVKAHEVALSTLVLDDEGSLGVMIYVPEDRKALFKEVTIIDQNNESVWISGLSDETKIIVLGQGYIKNGTEVLAKADK